MPKHFSFFGSDLTGSILVWGYMTGGTGAGRHMWNIVTMEDGQHYLADITNCDTGSVGADSLLFLAGYTSGDASGGYVYMPHEGYPISYVYDEEMTTLYASEELILSSAAYTKEGQQSEAPAFKTQSLLLSGQLGVNFYLDLSTLTDAEKQASMMTFMVEGETQEVPFSATHLNSTKEYYGFTCYVNSVQVAAPITAVFSYGDGETIEKTYSVEEYLAYFDTHVDSYSSKTITLVHSVADYGYHMQQFLSEARNWVIGTDHAAQSLIYTDSYDADMVKTKTEGYAIVKTGTAEEIE